jgi:CBS domain-containing protein
MITIRQLMKMRTEPDICTIHPDTLIQHALEYMAEKNVGAVCVVENGQMVGIFSERDFARKIIVMGKCSLETPVKEIMTHEMITINPEQTIDDAMLLMTKYHIRHLPVMEKGHLTSMVSMRELVEVILASRERTIEGLENYILGQGYIR